MLAQTHTHSQGRGSLNCISAASGEVHVCLRWHSLVSPGRHRCGLSDYSNGLLFCCMGRHSLHKYCVTSRLFQETSAKHQVFIWHISGKKLSVDKVPNGNCYEVPVLVFNTLPQSLLKHLLSNSGEGVGERRDKAISEKWRSVRYNTITF